MEMNLAQNIAELRKKQNLTQEQLAQTLNISAQAISKWERGTCQPDIAMLPMLAECFHVSIDYLFYGQDVVHDDVYNMNFRKTAAHRQMSRESYEDALKLFGYAHHGISCGNLFRGELYDSPAHISNENGLSIFSGKGFGAAATRSFFESVTLETVQFAMPLLNVMADLDCFRILMAIVSMSDISFSEMQEKLQMEEDSMRAALAKLTAGGYVKEKASKHKSLGTTYEITDIYHTCICLILALLEMQHKSMNGISCCMGYGDYPISFES